MVKETRRPKPTTVNISEELGFQHQRLPATGPGSHKPNLGRGGLPLPSEYYLPNNDLVVPTKKGVGIGEKAKSEKGKKTDTSTPKWSDVV